MEEIDPESEKKLTDRELFSVLWDLVQSHRLLFVLVVTFLILNTALAISTPLIYHYILKSIEDGVTSCTHTGGLSGYPVIGVKTTLVGGNFHPADSSDVAFAMAASHAFQTGLTKSGTVLLEPLMKNL